MGSLLCCARWGPNYSFKLKYLVTSEQGTKQTEPSWCRFQHLFTALVFVLFCLFFETSYHYVTLATWIWYSRLSWPHTHKDPSASASWVLTLYSFLKAIPNCLTGHRAWHTLPAFECLKICAKHTTPWRKRILGILKGTELFPGETHLLAVVQTWRL